MEEGGDLRAARHLPFPLAPGYGGSTVSLRSVSNRSVQSLFATVLFVSFLAGVSAPATAQVRINEILASNDRTSFDEDNDSADWVELVNTGDEAVDLEGYSITDDSSSLRKWVFPSRVMQPGEHVIVWCSGKDRTQPSQSSVLADGSTVPFLATAVTLDAEYAYFQTDPELPDPSFPEGWATLDFDDGPWPRGKPGFGFSDDDDVTELAEDMSAALVRHVFSLDEADLEEDLYLQVLYDDGFVAFLNGEQFAVENFREEELNFFEHGRSIPRGENTGAVCDSCAEGTPSRWGERPGVRFC